MVAKYMRDRFALGASLHTVSAELASQRRRDQFGYKTPPGPSMLAFHVANHMTQSAPVSKNAPSFTTVPPAVRSLDTYVDRDVAQAIKTQALEQLDKGEMRLTAAHALRAQEMIDKRIEKQKDREMQVLLGRVLTRQRTPPPRYVGPDEDVVTIEGTAVEV
jgi:hypothetical protein